MPTGRTASVVFLGNDQALNATLARIETKLKALSTTAEEQNAKTAASADVAGARIGRAYDEGTTKAAAGLARLSALGASFGIPMTHALDNVGKKLDETTAKSHKLSGVLAEAGKVAAAGGLAAFAGAAYEGVKAAEKFQTSTASIAANAQITSKAAENIGKAFLDTAGHSVFSGQEMASSFAAVAGQLRITEGRALSSAEALRVMTASGDLAEASHQSLASTTAAVAKTMQAYHLSVSQAAQASDVLFNVSKSLNVPVDGVSTALGRLHGRLGVLAPSLRDTAGLMIDLGQHGITGTRGVQVVNTALQTLVGGSKKTTDVLHALGVSIFDQNGKFIGLQNVIAQLQPKLAGLTQQQQLFAEKALFGSGAAQVLGQIVAQGASKFDTASNAATRLGSAHRAAALQGKTLHDQIELLKATVSDLATKFGLFLIPKLEATGRAIQSVIGWMGKHRDIANALAAVIAGVLGTAITVFAYTKAVAFVGATRDMVGGLVGLIAKTGLTGASFGALGGEAVAGTAAAEGAVTGMATTVEGADTAIVSANEAAGASFTALLGPIAAVAAATGGALLLIHQLGGAGGAGNPGGVARNQDTTGLSPRLGSLGIGSGAGGGGTAGHSLSWLKSHGLGTGSTGATGSNADQIARALAAQGFSKVAIAGILGNFAQETGGGSLAAINTRDSGTGASGIGGMGIAQWTAGRRVSEMQYAASQGLAPTSLTAQIGYLIKELRTSYHGAFNAVQGAKSPQQAAALFNQLYEGGTDPGGVRESAASHVLASLGGGNRQLAALMGGSGAGGGKATMRYVNHQPVGVMTEAQWQHWQHTHGPSARQHGGYSALAGSGLTYAGPDQGIDFTGRGNVYAPDASRVVKSQASGSGWPGQGAMTVMQYTAGPRKGQYWYVTEDFNPKVHAGQQIAQGGLIGVASGSGKAPGIEVGFAQGPSGAAYGTIHDGKPGGPAPVYGRAMADYVRSRSYFSTGNGAGIPAGPTPAQLVAAAKAAIAKAFAAYIKRLTTSATSELTRLGNVMQSGTIRGLSAILGENTSTQMLSLERGAPRNWGPHDSVANVLGARFSRLGGGASFGQINAMTGDALKAGAANSPQEAAFTKLIARLDATHNKGLEKLATRLVAAHKVALQALGQELYAQQVSKNAEMVSLQATQTKDLTSMQANYDADMLNVQKAWYQTANDKAQAQVTAIRDMTTVVQDQFAGMVQAVTDSAKLMSDAASSTVQGIQDQTQVQVDILGERGLYGLNLVAQKLQVQLDQTKASDNQKVALAQQNLDQVTATWHAATSTAQIGLDQLTAQQNALVAQAQMGADLVTMQQDTRIAAAQARMDAVTLHEDVSVVGPAQIAVDLGATLPKAQQDVLGARLKWYSAVASGAEATAGSQYQGVYGSAQGIIGGAGQRVTDAQNAASLIIGLAGLNLTNITGQANAAIAGAQSGLTGAQSAAALNEAPLSSGVALTQARASTQFAGSGLVVNMYGVDLSNPTAVGNETSWALRTALNG